MATYKADSCVNGTLALDLSTAHERRQSSFRAYDTRGVFERDRSVKDAVPGKLESIALRHPLLASSELFCSLALEDFKGCAYNAFTRRQCAFLTALGCLAGVVSIALGA